MYIKDTVGFFGVCFFWGGRIKFYGFLWVKAGTGFYDDFFKEGHLSCQSVIRVMSVLYKTIVRNSPPQGSNFSGLQ